MGKGLTGTYWKYSYGGDFSRSTTPLLKITKDDGKNLSWLNVSDNELGDQEYGKHLFLNDYQEYFKEYYSDGTPVPTLNIPQKFEKFNFVN
jgi:hypothetical protein